MADDVLDGFAGGEDVRPVVGDNVDVAAAPALPCPGDLTWGQDPNQSVLSVFSHSPVALGLPSAETMMSTA